MTHPVSPNRPSFTRRASFTRRTRPRQHTAPWQVLRWSAAILASVAICVWPLWGTACCCRAVASMQTASDLPPFCRITATPTSNGFCTRASLECVICDGVKHDCPCEVRNHNLDRWVSTRSTSNAESEPDHGSKSFTDSSVIADLSWSDRLHFIALREPPLVLTSVDRCALLCRWLN